MAFLYILAALITILIIGKFFLQQKIGMCRCTNRLDGKIVIITGSNTGIGYETALDLARRGAKVILACRDSKKGKKAASDIIEKTNGNVHFRQLDLTSFASVRQFVTDIISEERCIDILINNAGVGKVTPKSLTSDGVLTEAQANHFGPFLLTNLLLPLLKNSQQGRIIMVSSLMHKFGKINLENIHKIPNNAIEHQRVYSNMKLCNLLFALELSRRLEGTNITVNSLHPGAVNTDIYRNMPQPLRAIVKAWMPKTPKEGAQTTIHLAVSEELKNVSGKYFDECKICEPSKSALDKEMAAKLWEFSEKLVKLD